MKILFVMRHPFFLKNFADAIAELRNREHEIRVVFSEPPVDRVGEHLTREVRKMIPSVPIDHKPPKYENSTLFAMRIATLLDILRYDRKEYDSAPKLRRRAVGKSSTDSLMVFSISALRLLSKFIGGENVNLLLHKILNNIPAEQSLLKLVSTENPDLLMVTPLTPIGSEQVAYILAAREAGIRVVYSMYSWDNLTNKGLLRPKPDAGIVWNPIHRQEAIDFHGMSEEQMFCTGAQGFDVWFNMKPSLTKKDFCTGVGLDPEKPFILYTCSSVFVGGKQEQPFVINWLKKLRAHPDPKVATLGVLIRPHPQFTSPWEQLDLSEFSNVVVYPRQGAIPFRKDDKEDYFHSIHFSSGIVGINTSAMIEAAILGKPILTIQDPSYADTQDGTLHFRHLQKFNFIQSSKTIDENLSLISRYLAGDPDLIEKTNRGNESFIKGYIRPFQDNRSSSMHWVDTVVSYEEMKTSPTQKTSLDQLIRALIKFKLKVESLFGKKEGQGKVTKKGEKGSKKKSRQEAEERTFASSKEIAKLNTFGPYRILKSIVDCFGEKSPCVGTVIFGDSVHNRVSQHDEDKRTLATMLEEKFADVGKALSLNSSAYHPGVYKAIAQVICRSPSKPSVLVIPVNLRCFSPQWWLNPEYQFNEEIQALENYQFGQEIPEVQRLPLTNEDSFDDIPVEYPGSPLRTIGQFRLITNAKPVTPPQWAWRARQIAIFHYLHPLKKGHPRLNSLKELIELAAENNIKTLVYVTPVNYEYGVKVAEDIFVDQLKRNVKELETEIASAIAKSQGLFADWSTEMGSNLFFHPEEKTEHLNSEGRKILVDQIYSLVKKIKA